MDILEAIKVRHSVRSYTAQPIDGHTLETLQAAVADCNRLSGLHIQLITGEPQAFAGRLARYGKFSGVSNYFALVGAKGLAGLDERVGYYGERLALHAVRLGLDTCWVGLTFRKTAAVAVGKGERLRCLIAVGHGATRGAAHRVKSLEQVARVSGGGPAPLWFTRGVQAALLAPTALNQQKFRFTLYNENLVEATAGRGFFSHVDLGIVKYHFEQAAGRDNFEWL